MKNQLVKNIILDLGGVLLNIDYTAPVKYFEALGVKGFEDIYSKRSQLPLFDAFEKGMIGPEEFREELRILGNFSAPDADIDQAWNSMLLDLPPHRMKLLSQLRKDYPLFLLSNTNEIHVKSFEEDLNKTYGPDKFQQQFTNYYYSCRMKMRKPDPQIFLFVMDENDLYAGETLFIDDSPQHIEGALKTGMRAEHLANGAELGELLQSLGII